jgi:uncharacterized protein (TIGR02145 family)
MKTKKVFLSVMFGILFFSTNGIGQTKKPVAKKTTPSVNSNPSVIIGDQEWMSKNLDVSRFRNGDPIPEAKTKQAWADATAKHRPAWCYPEIGYSQIQKYGKPEKYGKLYNYYAVSDPRGLAPKGWSVPNASEWSKLIKVLNLKYPLPDPNDYYISTGKEGYYLMPHVKNIDSWYFLGEDLVLRKQKNTNSSGFNAMPAGNKWSNGRYEDLGFSAYWWVLHTPDDYHCYAKLDSGDSFKIISINEEESKGDGYSIRCIKIKEVETVQPDFYKRAVEKFNAKDYEGAIQEMNSYIKIYPEDYNGYYVRGNYKTWLNDDWKGALEDYDEGWNLVKLNHLQDEKNAQFLAFNLGQAIIATKNKERAWEACMLFNEIKNTGIEDVKDMIHKYCATSFKD